MATSESFAIAAHMHVVLRRKTGRVTDTEWMATNAAYATEVVRFAREKGLADGHEDLLKLADRLTAEIPHMEKVARKPLVEVAVDAVRRNRESRAAAAPPATSAREGQPSGFLESTLSSMFGTHGDGHADSPHPGTVPEAERYIGHLR